MWENLPNFAPRNCPTWTEIIQKISTWFKAKLNENYFLFVFRCDSISSTDSSQSVSNCAKQAILFSIVFFNKYFLSCLLALILHPKCTGSLPKGCHSQTKCKWMPSQVPQLTFFLKILKVASGLGNLTGGCQTPSICPSLCRARTFCLTKPRRVVAGIFLFFWAAGCSFVRIL